MILDATTKTLEVDLNAAVATAQLPFVGTYCALTKGIPQELVGTYGFDGATNGTTAVTLFAAPGANLTYAVKTFSIKNSDTAAVLLWIQLNNNTTLREIVRITLAVNDTLQYKEGIWSVIDTSGQTKMVMPNYLPLAGGVVTGSVTLTAAAPQLILGVNATTLGAAKFFGSTSGSVTVQPAAIAGGTLTCTLPNANSTLPIFTQQITFAGPTVPRTITLPDAAFTVARSDAGQIFAGIQQMTSPDITTSITTPSTTFTVFAGATTLLTIGGTGASAVVAIPGTKTATSGTAAAVTIAGGLAIADNIIAANGISGGVISGSSINATSTITSTVDAGMLIQPATGTNAAYFRYTNTGGTLYCGLDSSTASEFGTAGNYGTVIYRPASTGFAISRGATVDIEVSSAGAVTIPGTAVNMTTSGTTLTVGVGPDNGTGSFGIITDRTKSVPDDIDALAAIGAIKSKNGHIDHDTLPEFARAKVKKDVMDYVVQNNNGMMVATYAKVGEVEATERSLGAMLSIHDVGFQQMIAELQQIKSRLTAARI